jgi:two-component system CheB/CheR fusion protein
MASRIKTGVSKDRVVAAQPLRVLVVEDVLDVAEALAVQLKEWGYDCRVCTSGHEAAALAPYYHPNVVLIDIGLPDISGWDLAKRLPRDALLVAVTARGEEGDFKRSEWAGIRYHLVKPAYQRQLRDLLERLRRESG